MRDEVLFCICNLLYYVSGIIGLVKMSVLIKVFLESFKWKLDLWSQRKKSGGLGNDLHKRKQIGQEPDEKKQIWLIILSKFFIEL